MAENKRINGLPGIEGEEAQDPKVSAMLLTHTGNMIRKDDIDKAVDILRRYKEGKSALEERVVDDELWWELRHWEAIRKKKNVLSPEPTSAWLFNAILNKHADAMDNYPEALVLPREASDKDTAKMLSDVLPVVMEYSDFHDTYSDNWWEKLKHGTAVYGVFWDSERDNGLGDIDIKPIDLLKIFWEPGITDIQNSKNLFITEMVDTEELNRRYPDFDGKLQGKAVDVKQYQYDENISTEDKSVVVDWYYKVRGADGVTRVHYCKFVGDSILYASENDPDYRERGYYDHGMYPVVFDVLFPEKGTPCGFGYVAITKSPQMYIDKLSANIMERSMMGTKPRYFASDSANINVEQFKDWSQPIVKVTGSINDERIRELKLAPVDGIYMNVLQQKIEEMKDTAANRDVNSGGTGSGVTAAAAIAALQEAGNKASRDMISASYRAHTKIVRLCIELMRQFYTETRSFRITAPNELGYDFVDVNNFAMQDQITGVTSDGMLTYRRPIFDLDIRAQKKNPFSQMEANERAKELYSMGFFSPDRAQESLIALEMMDFEGIEQVKQKVSEGQTLYNLLMQAQGQLAAIGNVTGLPVQLAGDPAQTPVGGQTAVGGLASAVKDAHQMTDYGQQLARNSVPSVEG